MEAALTRKPIPSRVPCRSKPAQDVNLTGGFNRVFISHLSSLGEERKRERKQNLLPFLRAVTHKEGTSPTWSGSVERSVERAPIV